MNQSSPRRFSRRTVVMNFGLASALVGAALAWPPGPARAQEPTAPPSPSPSPTAPRRPAEVSRRLFLPAVDLQRPYPELLLQADTQRVGGDTGGMAYVNGVIYQVQGNSLLHWRRVDGAAPWTVEGQSPLSDVSDPAFEATQVQPCDGAACVAQQVRDRIRPWGNHWQVVKIWRPQSRCLQVIASRPHSTLTAYAVIGDTGLVAYDTVAGEHVMEQVETFYNEPMDHMREFPSWRPPATVSKLLILPETNELVARLELASGPELWIWKLHDRWPTGDPRRVPDADGDLVRLPEGLAIVKGSRVTMLPIRDSRLAPEARQQLWLQETATVSEGREFSLSHGHVTAVWAAGMLCLFDGMTEYAPSLRKVRHNVLGCYDLSRVGRGGIYRIRHLVAADLSLDLSPPLTASEDTVFVSGGRLGGFEILRPLDAENPTDSVDAPGGAIHTVIRRGDQLITAEGDMQLRTWDLDHGAPDSPQPLARLSLPAAGALISRDLAGTEGTGEDVVLFRGDAMGYRGAWQRVHVSPEGELTPAAPQPNPEVAGLLRWARSAGSLLWSLAGLADGPGSWPVWRLDPEKGLEPDPLSMPGIRLVDSALDGPVQVLAAASDGLLVLGEHDQVLGRLPLDREAVAVAVNARTTPDRVWVATGAGPHDETKHRDEAGLHCVDISDPSQPRLVGSLWLAGAKVDRLRLGGGRLLAGGMMRREVDNQAYFDPFLISLAADRCVDPVVEAMTQPRSLPQHLAPLDENASFSWDLSADGQWLYAARTGLAAYRLEVKP